MTERERKKLEKIEEAEKKLKEEKEKILEKHREEEKKKNDKKIFELGKLVRKQFKDKDIDEIKVILAGISNNNDISYGSFGSNDLIEILQANDVTTKEELETLFEFIKLTKSGFTVSTSEELQEEIKKYNFFYDVYVVVNSNTGYNNLQDIKQYFKNMQQKSTEY